MNKEAEEYFNSIQIKKDVEREFREVKAKVWLYNIERHGWYSQQPGKHWKRRIGYWEREQENE